MFKGSLLVLLFGTFHHDVLSQVSTSTDSLFSGSLGRTKQFSVVLPDGYVHARKYPVLYLLHGYGGDHRQWLMYSNILKYVEHLPIVVVLPDAERSYYVNSATVPRDRFEDYLVHDLPAYVRSRYSIDTLHQAIAGASMGGYGALVLAFRNPGRFFFAGDISGSTDIPQYIESHEHGPFAFTFPGLRKAFGPEPGPFYDAHNLFRLYKTVAVDSLPYLYLSVGIQDQSHLRLTTHRALAESLSTYGAYYEYHETPGTHSLKFFDKELLPLLQRMDDVMRHGYKSVVVAVRRTIATRGVEEAIKQCRRIRQDPNYYLGEDDLDGLGHELLKVGKVRAAIEVLRLNTELFPRSTSTLNSLGAAYMALGNTDLARQSYKKSLEMDPKNVNAIEMLKKTGGEVGG